MVFLSLGWQEIKILSEEQVLVLCSALKWRVAIATKQRALKAKPAKDLSIGSTETKYIKLNTKTRNIFCCVSENLTTFLCTLTGGTRKQKEKKKFSL